MPHILAAGNWYAQLPIEYGFVEWPSGPLELDSDIHEKMVWVEAWVMQKATGAVQMTYQAEFEDPKKWTANLPRYPEPWTGGLFKPGWALGTAIAISNTDYGQQYYYWIQEVALVVASGRK
jgi:hypothetical protein